MAKIDIGQIAGYAEMTAEQKVEALEQYELQVPENTGDDNQRLRNALNKANSEAAEWKRQYRETLSEQERREAERKEQQAAIESELTALRRDKTIGNYKAEYLAMGYSPELASRKAAAVADGNMTDAFDIEKQFMAEQKKAYEAAALNQQPTLTTGKPATSADAEEAEYQKLRHYAGLT